MAVVLDENSYYLIRTLRLDFNKEDEMRRVREHSIKVSKGLRENEIHGELNQLDALINNVRKNTHNKNHFLAICDAELQCKDKRISDPEEFLKIYWKEPELVVRQ